MALTDVGCFCFCYALPASGLCPWQRGDLCKSMAVLVSFWKWFEVCMNIVNHSYHHPLVLSSSYCCCILLMGIIDHIHRHLLFYPRLGNFLLFVLEGSHPMTRSSCLQPFPCRQSCRCVSQTCSQLRLWRCGGSRTGGVAVSASSRDKLELSIFFSAFCILVLARHRAHPASGTGLRDSGSGTTRSS